MPGVRETLAQVSWRDADSPRFGIASNQDHVGYGLLSLGTAQELLRELAVAATDYLPPVAALQLCPHPAEMGCRCRKPEPEMLLAIMRHYAVTPEDTVFVGNEESDREAATRAGTNFIWSRDFFRQAQ